MPKMLSPCYPDANELMAWISHLKGDHSAAKGYAEKLFVTNMKGATTLYKAGLIFSAAGDAAKGDSLKKEALAIMPYVESMIVAAGR